MIKIGNGYWFEGDCLEVMKTFKDKSFDMILCDLPYGTTQNKWDSVIPFRPLWEQYWRVARDLKTPIVLTAQCPFDKMLGTSQIQHLKYEWVWEKPRATGHLNAKKQAMKAHENILIFYQKQCLYNPQKTFGHKNFRNTSNVSKMDNYGNFGTERTGCFDGSRLPRSVQIFKQDDSGGHPTQKPVELFEYLIKTYTNPGDIILDNCAGSGTTAIAAENTGRKWVCIEKDAEYSRKAIERIRSHLS